MYSARYTPYFSRYKWFRRRAYCFVRESCNVAGFLVYDVYGAYVMFPESSLLILSVPSASGAVRTLSLIHI